ncbi:MAG: HAMP domain-containing protein, partial [Bacteroidetes bacterium]|nr:HAMP domain-containing protein [Bacteroidota bacterium]
MDWFLLQPFSVILLTQGLLSFFITLYLLSIKPKTWASWLVAIAVATFTLLLLEKVLEVSLYTPLPFNLFALDELLRPIIVFAFLHFAYVFLENPFPRESKIVLWLTSAFLVGNILYQGYRVVALQGILEHIYYLLFGIANLAMVLWATGVFLRKMLIFSPHTGRIVARLVRVEGKEARALRAFALFTFAWVPLSIHSIWLGIDTPPRFTDYIVLLTLVVVIIGFVVGYINHMPEPTTFQVKLIGLALATILTVLSLTVEVLYPEDELIQQSNALLPDRQSLQFEPDEKGGYRMAHRPFRFDPDLGENVVFGGADNATVALGFPFSYYGTSWDSVNVTGNGVVAFGGRFQPQAFDEFYNELPKIAPLFIDLNPAPGGVFFKQDSSKATVTWHQVAQFGTFNLNTTQLVLHEDGAIAFTYDGIDARVDEGLRGLYPGGPDPPLEAVRFSGFLPDRQTLRLEPDGRETYQATPLPSQFNPDLGENLGLGDDDNATVTLGFSFPFYDTHWNEVHVGANGVVAFGGNINPPESERYRPLRDFYNELPKIAPFFIDLNPLQGGGVFYRREADQATITWHQVPQFGTLQRSTVQLVLHQRGTIDFTYDGIVDLAYDRSEAQLLIGGVWGLHPGGSDPRLEPVGLAEALPYQGPARAGLVEDFRLQYRRFVHRTMLPFVYVVLGTTLFILVVFPFFFRTSLIKPLEALLRGVQRVNTGDLEARVPVRVNDEIGILAQNFNQMTTSLKSAEEQLKA